MTDPVQTEACGLGSMCAVATRHRWQTRFLNDGSINFDPPPGETDTVEQAKVRARLMMARVLGPLVFLGVVDNDAGVSAFDAAAEELRPLFDSYEKLRDHLLSEAEEVKRILASCGEQIDQWAAMMIRENKARRN